MEEKENKHVFDEEALQKSWDDHLYESGEGNKKKVYSFMENLYILFDVFFRNDVSNDKKKFIKRFYPLFKTIIFA